MKKVIVFIFSIFLVACTTVQEETRVSSDLKVSQFNSLSYNFMGRPTFVSLESMSDGEKVLAISMDDYGSSSSLLRFSAKHVDDYRKIIDKYYQWEKLALERGDVFTKHLGEATTWGNIISGSLSFDFHSGNAANHYLLIKFCSLGKCLDDNAFYFDMKNTHILESLLKRLKNGEIEQTNLDAVYQ